MNARYVSLKIIVSTMIFISSFYSNGQTQVNSTPATKKIEVDMKLMTYLNFDDIFSTVNYINLEKTQPIQIKRVNKLMLTDESIIVWDKESILVHIFDNAGKFLASISNTIVPAQKMAIYDVVWDEVKKNIIILDLENQLIFRFKKDGGFIAKQELVQMDKSGPIIEVFNDHLFFDRALYNFDGNSLAIFKTEPLNFFNSKIPLPDFKLKGSIEGENLFSKHNNKLYYLPPLLFSIYEIDKSNKVERSYDITFLSNQIELSQLKGKLLNIQEFHQTALANQWVVDIRNMIVTDQLIYFRFIESGIYHDVFYNRQQGKTKVFYGVKGDAKEKIWNGSVGMLNCTNNNEWVGVIDSSETANKIISINTLQEKSNITLAFYTLNKDFLK